MRVFRLFNLLDLMRVQNSPISAERLATEMGEYERVNAAIRTVLRTA